MGPVAQPTNSSSDASSTTAGNASSSIEPVPPTRTGCSSWRAAAQQWLAGSTLGQELSGSLGDLGTFLPLVVSVVLLSVFLVCGFRNRQCAVTVPSYKRHMSGTAARLLWGLTVLWGLHASSSNVRHKTRQSYMSSNTSSCACAGTLGVCCCGLRVLCCTSAQCRRMHTGRRAARLLRQPPPVLRISAGCMGARRRALALLDGACGG